MSFLKQSFSKSQIWLSDFDKYQVLIVNMQFMDSQKS